MPSLKYRWRHNRIRQFIDRGRNGFSPDDCWNLDTYIFGVLSKAITQYAKDANGFPSNLESQEQWQAILAEMAEGFRVHAEEAWNLGYADGEFSVEAYKQDYARMERKLNRSLSLLKKHYRGLWW